MAHATDSLPQTFTHLPNQELQAAYCHYALTVNITLSGHGPDRMQVISLISTLQDWERIFLSHSRDRQTQDQLLAEGKRPFLSDVTRIIQETQVSQPEAQRTVIDQTSQECHAIFRTLASITSSPQPITNLSGTEPSAESQAFATPPKVPQPKPTSAPLHDSPFHKGVFRSGWHGKLFWPQEVHNGSLIINSEFDMSPPYDQTEKIHVNVISLTRHLLKHCLTQLLEFDRSADGMTLFLKPISYSRCSGRGKIVSIQALKPDLILFEVRHDEVLLATAELSPREPSEALTFTPVQARAAQTHFAARIKAEEARALTARQAQVPTPPIRARKKLPSLKGPLKNPHGLFLVNLRGIYAIKVDSAETNQKGYYHFTAREQIYRNSSIEGWWIPARQILEFILDIKNPKAKEFSKKTKCRVDYWWNSQKRWSYIFALEDFSLDDEDEVIQVYRETARFMEQKEPLMCERLVRTGYDCKVRCPITIKRPPGFFIVQSPEQAYEVYESIK